MKETYQSIQFPWEAWEFDDPNKDATPVLRLKNPWLLEVVDSSGIWTINQVTGFTPIGGFAVKMTSGITSPAKGQIVHVKAGANDTVELVPIGDADSVGIVYDGTVDTDGKLWIVTHGKADVLFINAATAGNFARVCLAADSSVGTPGAGYAVSEPFPSPPLATDEHFMEIGHVAQTTSAPGLARIVLHWN